LVKDTFYVLTSVIIVRKIQNTVAKSWIF